MVKLVLKNSSEQMAHIIHHRELKLELKFQRRSCRLSFLFPLLHQSTSERLLAGQPFYYGLNTNVHFNKATTTNCENKNGGHLTSFKSKN